MWSRWAFYGRNMTAERLVAIHQPNFFPWLGYFNKIARADVFILLDNVQFPKTGGAWTNRVQLLIGGKANWVTAPIVRAYHGVRRIDEMQLNNSTPWREKMLKTIQLNYRRAPFYEVVFPFLAELVSNPSDRLAEYNLTAIRALATAIGLDVSKFVLGSTLNVDRKASDMLIAMIKAVCGTAYLAGGGAAGYQEDDKFAAADLGLVYQDFQHPTYPQVNTAEFIPGLSVIDALMNCGFEGVRALVAQESAEC